MPRIFLAFVVVGAFVLGCAGPGTSGAGGAVIRVDYSHVDGGSCMSGGGKPSLAFRQEWKLEGCKTRAEGPDDLSDACRASYNAECCTQIGAKMLGWQVRQVGGEKLVSPLCQL